MEEFEKVENVEIYETYDDDIDFYFSDFCEKYKIEDMVKESQSRFNACMMYIGKALFSDPSILRQAPSIAAKHGAITNANLYNVPLLNDLCDKYIYMCLLYSKEISITGFSYMVNINNAVIEGWGNDNSIYYESYIRPSNNTITPGYNTTDNNIYINNSTSDENNIYKKNRTESGECQPLNVSRFTIYQKLHKGREESLQDMLTTGKRNPVGILSILNHFYNWSTVYAPQKQTQTHAIEDIRARYNPELLESVVQNADKIEQNNGRGST